MLYRSSLIFTLCLCACVAQSPADDGKATANKELDASLADFLQVFNSHDAKAVASTYTDDASLRMFGVELKGRKAIEADALSFFQQNPNVKHRVTDVERHFVTPRVVVEDGAWHSSGLSDANAPKTGRYTAVLVKQNGTWVNAAERVYAEPVVATSSNANQPLAKLTDYIRAGTHEYKGETLPRWEGTDYGPAGGFSGTSKVRAMGVYLLEEWTETYSNGDELSGVIVYSSDKKTKGYVAEHYIGNGLKSNIKITLPDSHSMVQEFQQVSASGEKSLVKGLWKYSADRSSADATWQISFDDGKTWAPWLTYTIKQKEK